MSETKNPEQKFKRVSSIRFSLYEAAARAKDDLGQIGRAHV
jgi:hypothetical protein